MEIKTGLAEGQVLQRLKNKGATALLSGTCAISGPVFATVVGAKGWKNKKVGQSKGGIFSAKLVGIPAGGPYKLTLSCGSERAALKEFYVGDVWILAGQSNMEGVGNMTNPAKPHPLIRAFSMRHEWRQAIDPLHRRQESADGCHYDGMQCSREMGEKLRREAVKGVGVGIFFARDMLKRSGVPQGLIATAHGGTSMNQWDPERKADLNYSMYGSMLKSVLATQQPVAGMLWYQGESDANETDAPHYAERMKKLVAATRRDLKQPALPWVIVQLGRFLCSELPRGVFWNRVQEEQRLLPQTVKYLETVPAIDFSLDDGIHISSTSFPQLGARMARAAARLVYGDKKEKRPPQLRAILSLESTKLGFVLDVIFDSVVGDLKAAGEPNGFTLLGPDLKDTYLIYRVTLHGARVRLHMHGLPPEGARLIYGLGTNPVCNITDARGEALPVFGPLPLSAFPVVNRR